MPYEYAWQELVKDCSEIELEVFLDGQKAWKKKSSNHDSCTVCSFRRSAHNMHYAIYQCNSAACISAPDALPCQWYIWSKVYDQSKRGSIAQPGTHNNDIADTARITLNLTMKRFIRHQTKLKLTPSRILNTMIDNGFFAGNAYEYLACVQRFSYHYKTTTMHDNNNIDEMEELLASRPYHEALHDSTAFGFGYESATQLGARHHVLHIDATFKLNTARFPAIALGVSDMRRQFHPVAFFITSDLRQAQVEKVVRATVKQYELVTGSVASIRYVMADADVAQRNAVEVVVAQELGAASQPQFLMYFFHVMQNVKKYMSGVPLAARPLLFKHIYRMHYARSPADLHTRITEAIQAWRLQPGCQDFERLFSQQWWTARFVNWQSLCTPPGFAKTNNPLEQFNKEIKRDYSLRSLISVNALAQAFLDMCHHRSARAKPFATTPHAFDDQARRYRLLLAAGRLAVTSAYRSSIEFMNGVIERRVFRVFQSGADAPPRPRKVASQVLNDEAIRAEQDVEIDGQPSIGWNVNVDDGTCDCRSWFKFGFCTHLIASRLKLDMPVEGMITKRKFVNKSLKDGKGKHSKVGHALAQI